MAGGQAWRQRGLGAHGVSVVEQRAGLLVGAAVSLWLAGPPPLAVAQLNRLPGGRPRGRAFHLHIAALPETPWQAGQVPDGGIWVLTAQGSHAGPQPLFREEPFIIVWARAVTVAVAVAPVQAAAPPVQRPRKGLPAMLPVGRQGGMVLMPVGPAWPLRGLEAGKELTARNLVRGRGVGRAL